MFIGSAGLSFFVGGRAISGFGPIDRFQAELAGFGLAVGCGVLGFVAKTAGERVAESGEGADLPSEHSSEE